ncbi:MAG: hypothetical protein M3P83_06830 [Actinomycetota bacterium]|nr:hypothetical protein [Actinomycetota bacterium]
MSSAHHLPDVLPVLSRGKHRNPRKGACFMELASYLAGERWSDHPRCTHPLLSALARLVNDCTSDSGRSRLAQLIPSVIGLTSDDLRWDARIALHAAQTALPVVSAERQCAMAVSILSGERVLAEIDGRPVALEPRSEHALHQVPHAAAWARRFAGDRHISAGGFRRHAAPNAVRCSVQGIAEACVPDSDELLHELLSGAIDACTGLAARGASRRSVDAQMWSEVCELTGVR